MRETRFICVVSLLASLMAVGGWITIHIPLSPVPVTLQTLFVFLSAFVLGRKGVYVPLVYVLLGGVGLPIFAGFSGGMGVLAGPTGGYLVGFIPAVFIMGYVMEKWQHNLAPLLASLLGILVIYTCGGAWLSFVCSLPLKKTIALGVAPFLVGDLFKMFLSWILYLRIKPIVYWGEGKGLNLNFLKVN